MTAVRAALWCGVLAATLGALGCMRAAATPAMVTPALLEHARAHGTARCIVEMRVPAGATQAEIEAVKRRVLAQIAPTRHRVLRDLPGFPMLVLDASEATLQELSASPDVLRISAEMIHRPQR